MRLKRIGDLLNDMGFGFTRKIDQRVSTENNIKSSQTNRRIEQITDLKTDTTPHFWFDNPTLPHHIEKLLFTPSG